jgi:hypothetical protein
MAAGRDDVPAEVLAALRAVCRSFPEVVEEAAWVGTRWRVRWRTFAHTLLLAGGWPPAYARAAGTDGPAIVLTFRSVGPELDVLRAGGRPFFAPPWRADEVGLLIDDATDWQEVSELLTESYCVQAPAALRAAVDRPPD